MLGTSRFFPDEDDSRKAREAYSDQNLKVNEYLHRRVDIEDVVSAHLLAAEQAQELGFRKYVISATTPFRKDDLPRLQDDLPGVLAERFPEYEAIYRQLGWRMFPGLDRVYLSQRARDELGWTPRYDLRSLLDRLKAGADHRSPLARAVGSKGYHAEVFSHGPYPVE